MKYGDDFKLRNDNEVRLLFCSVTLVLCYSQKYTILDDLEEALSKPKQPYNAPEKTKENKPKPHSKGKNKKKKGKKGKH